MSDILLDKYGTYTAQKTSEALENGWPIIVNEGGARCFRSDQLIITNFGSKPISELGVGDMVLSYNFDTGVDEFCTVSGVNEMKNKSGIKIKLKSGKEINCTSDHKIYFARRWCEAKEIVSLWNVHSKKL